MEENKEIEIDFRKLFSMLKRKLIFIIIITLIGGTLAGCYTNFLITPQYTASVKLHAWSNNENLMSSNTGFTSSDYQAAEMLVNTYLEVINSYNFLEEVAQEVGNDMSAGRLKGMVSASQIRETIAFRVSVTSSDPQEAKDIANIIAELCPREMVRILKVGGVEVIDYAVLPTSPSSPNVKKNVLIGLIAGFAVSFAFFFIKELFNTSISDEEDLTREFDIPIIGTVPKLVPVKASVQQNTTVEPPKPSIVDFSEKEDK